MSRITRRASALAGIALGPVWLATVALVTALEWDYLHSLGWDVVHHGEIPYPSITATGDWGLLQIANFALAGILAGVFLVGFRQQFTRRWPGRVATAGLGLFATAGLLNAFPTDPTGEPVSWHGWLHGFGFLGTMLGALVGFAASGLALRGNPDWNGWRLMGAVPAVLLLIGFTGLGLPGDLGWYPFLVLVFGWFSVMGWRLLHVGDPAASPDAAVAAPTAFRAASPGLL